ncbi:MAG: hypothetical protein ACMUJM_24855 [bacterium]
MRKISEGVYCEHHPWYRILQPYCGSKKLKKTLIRATTEVGKQRPVITKINSETNWHGKHILPMRNGIEDAVIQEFSKL